MSLVINLLVADDVIENAQNSLYESMVSVTEQETFSPPWRLPLLGDDFVEIQAEFLNSSLEVKKKLMDSVATSSFDLIVLDNNWYGDKRWGTDLIIEIHRAGIQHPPIVLYSIEFLIPHLADALKHGALAAVQKTDHYHFMNILISIAIAKQEKLKQLIQE